jgi:hypothetical protein
MLDEPANSLPNIVPQVRFTADPRTTYPYAPKKVVDISMPQIREPRPVFRNER